MEIRDKKLCESFNKPSMGFTRPCGFHAYSLKLSSGPEAEPLCDFAGPERLLICSEINHSPVYGNGMCSSVPSARLSAL